MVTSSLRRVAPILLITVLALVSPGCFLQTISGATYQAGDSLITTVETDSILATCVNGGFGSANVECTYFFFDENGVPVEAVSSAQLISEFGILGVIIDPLILQVPLSATDVTGTYDDGNGTSGDLAIQSGFKSIPADTYRHLFAEPGTQFIIAELPDGVLFEDIQFNFSVSFSTPPGSGPVHVKPILSVKYESGQSVFYTPLLPCETDMTNVPAIAIPEAATPQPITISAAAPQGCAGEQYLLAGFGVYPCDFDNDDDVDRNDIIRQARLRNSPALMGDRLDANGNGWIDIFDVRSCIRQCTRLRCATF